MRMLDKYILREYIINLMYCLVTFCMIYVVVDLFSHLSRFHDAKTPALVIMRYYLAFLAPEMHLLVPASLLLATLYTLWQFARHNELTAMRASGVSIYRIMFPFLTVGFAFTILIAALNETVIPDASRWANSFSKSRFKKMKEEVILNYPYINSKAHRQWNISKFNSEKPELLIGVEITEERDDGTRKQKLIAEKAEWLDGRWWMHNVIIQRYNNVDDIEGNKILRTLTEMPNLTETPADLLDTKQQEFMSAYEIIQHLKKNPDMRKDAVDLKKVDLHKHFAMPWACLIITVFGIPIGSTSGRQSPLTGIFLAIGLLLGFYIVLQFGLILGQTHGLFPWLGAWLSNIIFFSIGIFMTIRIR